MYESKVGGIGFVAGRWPLDRDLLTIVFIHGSGGSSVLWHAQVEALADGMNTIALDLPGHGRSDGEGFSCVEDYAAAAEGFIDLSRTFSISGKTDPSKVEPLVESMAACSPGVALGDFKACDAFAVMERVAEIEVPVLVLTASDDNLTPVKYGTFLADRLGNSFIVNIADAGHLSPMEKPEEVTRAILEFVLSL